MPHTNAPFEINQEVRLRAESSRVGVIREIRERPNGRYDYLVYFDQANQTWFSQDSLLSAAPPIEKAGFVSRREFLRDIAIAKLRSRLTDTLYSYMASRTYIEPYQFKPAMKFLESTNQRILLADEVGLGKTIEAGIIYLELKARTDLRRALIVCPSGLRHKWRDEMLERFDEEFVIMDARDMREFLDRFERYGGQIPLRGIVSLESIRAEGVQERMTEAGLHLDLAVVDEAHHMRNPGTLSQDVGLVLSEISDALLLLTATPVQLRSADLFHLLQVLDEGEFENLNEFEQLLEPNILINRASQMLTTDPKSHLIALAGC